MKRCFWFRKYDPLRDTQSVGIGYPEPLNKEGNCQRRKCRPHAFTYGVDGHTSKQPFCGFCGILWSESGYGYTQPIENPEKKESLMHKPSVRLIDAVVFENSSGKRFLTEKEARKESRMELLKQNLPSFFDRYGAAGQVLVHWDELKQVMNSEK